MSDRTRWKARAYLAIVACAVGLAAAGVARATTSDIVVEGNFNFQMTPDTLVLMVDKVHNVTEPPRISGELWLELWAFSEPYQGLGQSNYQQSGYRLGSYPLDRLSPGYFLFAVNSGPMPYQSPPPGTYYLTSLIVEYDASAIAFGGRLPRAYVNYGFPQSPLTIAPPGPVVTPQAGLWWDLSQPGTAYAITVKNGTAVVAVFSFQVDGYATWYFTSGPMSADGLTFSGTLDKFVGGPCIGCIGNRPIAMIGNDGNITIVFHTATAATVYLPGGRTANIVPAF
jgi:hypothetical protein